MTERVVDRHIEILRRQRPEIFGLREEGEEGEVVTRSSRRPLIIRPGLEVSRNALAQNRADTHTRLEHTASNIIAHLTGPVSGVVDGALNGIAEIGEDIAFGISKTAFGLKHGWERGKSQVQDDN